MVPVYPLLLFGGTGVHVELQRGQFVLSMEGGWIQFVCEAHEVREEDISRNDNTSYSS